MFICVDLPVQDDIGVRKKTDLASEDLGVDSV